jgi:hypothetical protein
MSRLFGMNSHMFSEKKLSFFFFRAWNPTLISAEFLSCIFTSSSIMGDADKGSEKNAVTGIAQITEHGHTPDDDHDPADHHHRKTIFKGIDHTVLIGGIQ